jgi:hypothetical protein
LPVEPARPAYPEDVIPVTPALRTTLERAWKAERWKLIWKVGIWVVTVAAAGYFLTGFNIFAIGVALFVLFSMVQQSRRRMQQLGLVAKDTSLRRIYGPVRTVELRGRTSRNKVQHPVTLANGTLVYVDGAAHQALGDVGRIATDEDGRTLGDDGSGSGIPIVVDYATVTYSATVPLILEIRDKSDRVIYTV